jgi:hypothetical protein
MSSGIDFLDSLNSHIGGKRTAKAKVERQKLKRLKITANAKAFERESKDNNYESPPPALPNNSGYSGPGSGPGPNPNSSLPGRPPNSEDNGNGNNSNNDDNDDSGLGGLGGLGSSSDFQGNSSTNSTRLSLEEIEKLKAAIKAEEEAKAKAKAKEAKAKAEEESVFMQEIGHFIESGNRGTARSGQRNTARGRTEFGESKSNEFGESVKKAVKSIVRGQREINKRLVKNRKQEQRLKSLAIGAEEIQTVVNEESVIAASTATNFVTAKHSADGPAISKEDSDFNQFREILRILKEEKTDLYNKILELIKSYGKLFYQKGGSEELAEIFRQVQKLLMSESVPRSYRKFIRDMTEENLRDMILGLFGQTKVGMRLAKEALDALTASAASYASAAEAPALISKSPNIHIQEKPANYGKALERRRVNGSVAPSGIQAFTTLREGGPDDPSKNFQLSKGFVDPKTLDEKVLAINAVKFKRLKDATKPQNKPSNVITNQNRITRTIKYIINSSPPELKLQDSFKIFRKEYKGNNKTSIYSEFAKIHPNILEELEKQLQKQLQKQPASTTGPKPQPVSNNEPESQAATLKITQKKDVPLLKYDFGSEEAIKKIKEILFIIKTYNLLDKYNQLLATYVNNLNAEIKLDDLYEELRKYHRLAKFYSQYPNYQRERLDYLLKEKYPGKKLRNRKIILNQMNGDEKREIILQLAKISSPVNREQNLNKLRKMDISINKEVSRLSGLNNILRKTEGQTLTNATKKRDIDRLMTKHSKTMKVNAILTKGNLDKLHKELVNIDTLSKLYPQFSERQRESFNSFLQSKYPNAVDINDRGKRKTKENVEEFIKSQSEKQRAKIFKEMQEEEERRKEENNKRKEKERQRLATFAKAPKLNKSFAKAVGAPEKVPAVNSNKVATITAPKPTYKNVLMRPKYKNMLLKNKPLNATSNNTQQLKKIDIIIENILKTEKIRVDRTPYRLAMIEEIKRSRLTEFELLALYIIFAENSLNLITEVNNRYKFEIKKLLLKIDNKKYIKIIKDIEKSIKNQLNRSRMPTVSSRAVSPAVSQAVPPAVSRVESHAELPVELPAKSRVESPAESLNNSSVNKILSNSESSLKFLKKNTLKIENELLEKKREKEKLEKELDSILKLTNKTNISKNMKAIKSEIEKLEKEISEKVKLEKQITKRRNLEKIRSEIEKLKTKLSEKNIEKINLEKKLAIKLNSIWKNSSKQMRNPRTIQSEIEKLNRSIKLLESSLEKNLNKIYDVFLNNLKGAKKALETIYKRTKTSNKNKYNEYERINRFEELMKELYELFNYLVKKYKFNGDNIKQKMNDNIQEYKENVKSYQRNNHNNPPNFPPEAISFYS